MKKYVKPDIEALYSDFVLMAGMIKVWGEEEY